MSKRKPFVCLFVLLLLVGCAKEPIQVRMLKSMEELERVYIPAFIFTSLQKPRESEVAVERLANEWRDFYRKYYKVKMTYGMNITDKLWREDFDNINARLASAEGYVKEKKLPAAYEKLEGVRYILLALRHRNGLDYFLDGLIEFNAALDKIIFSLKGKGRLTEMDVHVFRDLLKEAQAGLTRVEAAGADFKVFDLDDNKIVAIKERIKEEQKLLALFAAALSARKTDRISQSARDLKPNFIVLYKAFGDFQPVFDQVVKERKEMESQEKERTKND
ncbi:hypothetical protein A3H38_05635 [candidate division WOR-1 bacterium RIFCSPLOWO2_02_FULL_46_20]|uniref:Lipoprotein n=2 Tax=Saganbacteria TaxID=1703751 RepID=A0A1F4REP5_UNCSA|nr:MAG: hypothetical protein A3J44_01170 [candidate division WOR-1 bacterium RIFCSPHIGHO2_02_FULL_45_12]OGC06651.1 MAG: hypothetical protein A3H38_05635 [candidate division WOR-1 bacterium RIFCSPLOWO2_02_FULL_46_20]OGC09693.1 MAG: hypothetical protein A3F86_02290 [candidate division WOR-1 bacterium RIFCSPLOWO2_12_FULL_45_9]